MRSAPPSKTATTWWNAPLVSTEGEVSSRAPADDQMRKTTRLPSARSRYSPSLRATVWLTLSDAGRIQASTVSALAELSADDDGTRTQPPPARPTLVSVSPASAPA